MTREEILNKAKDEILTLKAQKLNEGLSKVQELVAPALQEIEAKKGEQVAKENERHDKAIVYENENHNSIIQSIISNCDKEKSAYEISVRNEVERNIEAENHFNEDLQRIADMLGN